MAADDRLLAPRPGGDEGHRGLDLLLDEVDVVAGRLAAGPARSRMPTVEALPALIVRRTGSADSSEPRSGGKSPAARRRAVADADRDLVEVVEDVELGQGDARRRR